MTDPRPDFTIIVPTKDRPDLLARALRSIAGQSFRDFELIVADDGTGQGAALARALLGTKASAFETGGLGQVPARNMALDCARGRRIAFLDDDDWWAAPDHLDTMKAALDRGAGLAYASGRIVRETGSGVATDWLPFAAHIDAQSIRRDNTLLVSGIAYEAALHEALGRFDESLPVYWDWDWYLRLAALPTSFATTGQDGVRISARIDNVSAPGNEAARATELKRLCDKHGLLDIRLKNHESIAVEQRARAGAPP